MSSFDDFQDYYTLKSNQHLLKEMAAKYEDFLKRYNSDPDCNIPTLEKMLIKAMSEGQISSEPFQTTDQSQILELEEIYDEVNREKGLEEKIRDSELSVELFRDAVVDFEETISKNKQPITQKVKYGLKGLYRGIKESFGFGGVVAYADTKSRMDTTVPPAAIKKILKEITEQYVNSGWHFDNTPYSISNTSGDHIEAIFRSDGSAVLKGRLSCDELSGQMRALLYNEKGYGTNINRNVLSIEKLREMLSSKDFLKCGCNISTSKQQVVYDITEEQAANLIVENCVDICKEIKKQASKSYKSKEPLNYRDSARKWLSQNHLHIAERSKGEVISERETLYIDKIARMLEEIALTKHSEFEFLTKSYVEEKISTFAVSRGLNINDSVEKFDPYHYRVSDHASFIDENEGRKHEISADLEYDIIRERDADGRVLNPATYTITVIGTNNTYYNDQSKTLRELLGRADQNRHRRIGKNNQYATQNQLSLLEFDTVEDALDAYDESFLSEEGCPILGSVNGIKEEDLGTALAGIPKGKTLLQAHRQMYITEESGSPEVVLPTKSLADIVIEEDRNRDLVDELINNVERLEKEDKSCNAIKPINDFIIGVAPALLGDTHGNQYVVTVDCYKGNSQSLVEMFMVKDKEELAEALYAIQSGERTILLKGETKDIISAEVLEMGLQNGTIRTEQGINAISYKDLSLLLLKTQAERNPPLCKMAYEIECENTARMARGQNLIKIEPVYALEPIDTESMTIEEYKREFAGLNSDIRQLSDGKYYDLSFTDQKTAIQIDITGENPVVGFSYTDPEKSMFEARPCRITEKNPDGFEMVKTELKIIIRTPQDFFDNADRIGLNIGMQDRSENNVLETVGVLNDLATQVVNRELTITDIAKHFVNSQDSHGLDVDKSKTQTRYERPDFSIEL